MQQYCINDFMSLGLSGSIHSIMLKFHSVSFTYDPFNRFDFPDFNVSKGEDLLILGESGIGKTTLLHLAAGLMAPDKGSISVMGTDITRLKGKELDRYRGAHVGIVFQKPHFVQSLTLGENLEMLRWLGKRKQDTEATDSLLEDLGLRGKIHSRPRFLSQGEQQRAGIALALVNSPDLILADEPTSALDDRNCQRVIDLLRSRSKVTGSSLVIITHDQRLKSEFGRSLTLKPKIS